MKSDVCIDENGRKFRGRKLILNWGNMKVEISKLPYLGKDKDVMFDLFNSDVLLANVYENPSGQLEDEVIGKPEGINGNVEGYRIDTYFTENVFWRLPSENIPKREN